MVGVAGFEPAASCSQGTRANQAALHPEHDVYKSLARKWQASVDGFPGSGTSKDVIPVTLWTLQIPQQNQQTF